MSVTPARVAALGVLRAVRGGALADRALADASRPLDARDRAWLQELVYGTFRRRGWLDTLLERRVHRGLSTVRPDVRDVLRLGAYQILEMDGVPAYAAVSQSVELARRVAGEGAARLVNGVLRGLDAGPADVPSFEEDARAWLTTRGSHPGWLVDRWLARYGADATRALVERFNRRPDIFLRPLGLDVGAAVAKLAEAGLPAEPVPGAAAVRLREGTDPAAALALVPAVVQDPAAGFVVDYAGVRAGDRVADLCAAPGGKALALAERVGPDGMVVAGDRTFGRMRRIRENAERLSALPVHPLVADARAPAVAGVDVVLVDVPCTGTGTLGRHPDARWRLEAGDLAALVALQWSILEGVAPAVRKGGLLVYATCSLEPEENEAQVEAFLERHPEFRPEPGPARPDLLDAQGRLVVLPHVHGFDGAFAARLRRT